MLFSLEVFLYIYDSIYPIVIFFVSQNLFIVIVIIFFPQFADRNFIDVFLLFSTFANQV